VGSRAGLAAIEAIIDASGAADRIEALLPAGARHRQLRARTLLTGMMLALDDRRPAYLTEVRAALTSLPGADQVRLGVTEDWHGRPHQLTYRQTEHTFRLIAKALSKDQPDGAPSGDLQAVCDQLLEASIPAGHKTGSSALAADWTDAETWSRPPPHGSTKCADPEAAWGHRNSNLPGPKGEMFFGYFLSAAVMAAEENEPPVPELARRATLVGCDHDPARQLAATLLRMAAGGIPLGDITGDSGYAHRDAEAWAIPLRQAGAQLVQDLHPHDRGPKGTHHGAVIANGNLYCPQTPKTLLELSPLPPGAAPDALASHDQQAAELSRYKLGRHTADDADGYHRAGCPATAGKIRCPLRPASMLLSATSPRSSTRPATRPPAAPSAPSPSRPRSRPRHAKTRLPIGGMAAVLPAAHQRRASQRHHQRPRHQQHRPRLVPAHWPGPDHPVDRLPARSPQPHPRRLERPPRRQHPPRRRRPAAPHPQKRRRTSLAELATRPP
jgi:hypothetical protein